MRTRTVFPKAVTLSCAFVAFAVARQAGADVAPPDGYVEQCTVAKKQRSSSECVECRAVREMYPNADRCAVLLSPYCFQAVCQAWGGASYPEVWCRTKGANAPGLPNGIASQLTSAAAPDLSSLPAPSGLTCDPYTPPADSAEGNGGCSVEPGWRARGLAWALAGIAGVGFVLARMRSARRRGA